MADTPTSASRAVSDSRNFHSTSLTRAREQQHRLSRGGLLDDDNDDDLSGNEDEDLPVNDGAEEGVSDDEDADADNQWVEFRSTANPAHRLEFNRSTNQVRLNGRGTGMQVGVQDGKANVTSRSLERVKDSLETLMRDVTDCLGVQDSPAISELLNRVKSKLGEAYTDMRAATELTSPIDKLIETGKLQHSVAIDYYRAASRQTRHRAIVFTDWHIPQYFSSQAFPQLPNKNGQFFICVRPPWQRGAGTATLVAGAATTPTSANDSMGASTGAGAGAGAVAAKSQQQTTITVSLTTPACEAIRDALVRLKIIEAPSKDAGVAPGVSGASGAAQKKEEEFVFKVIGQRDFLFGDAEMGSYAWVRSWLRDKPGQTMELMLVKRPAPLVTEATRAASERLIQEYESRLNPAVEVVTRQTWTHLDRVAETAPTALTHLPMSAVHTPFRVAVQEISRVTSEAFPRLNDLVTSVFVRGILFHGYSTLADPMDTPLQELSSNVRFLAALAPPFGASPLVSCLPREARLALLVVGRSVTGEEVQLGWVVHQLVDCRGYFATGPVKLRVWPFHAADSGKKGHGKKRSQDQDPHFLFRAPTIDNQTPGVTPALITLKFDSFALPVVAPLVQPYRPPNVRAVKPALSTETRLNPKDTKDVRSAIETDPLVGVKGHEVKAKVWEVRHHLVDRPSALPKFLQCVSWGDQDARNEAHRLLRMWAPPANPVLALELLDAQYADYTVREHAVNLLRHLGDYELGFYLLQLVQCLKFEPYHDSPLSRFLVERALAAPFQVGHYLFWHLKAELHEPAVAERFTLILEEFLSYSDLFVDEISKQTRVVHQLQRVAERVAFLKRVLKVSDEEAKRQYQEMVTKLNTNFFPALGKFQIPLNPRQEATTLRVDKCRYMSSKMVPLWLVFDNEDKAQAEPIIFIFKSGDDLRQDLLTLQLLRVMDQMWLSHKQDLRLKPYLCIATGVNEQGKGVGMIEVVKDSDTTSGIQIEFGGGASGALKLDPIERFIQHHTLKKDSEKEKGAHYRLAVENFVRSCAGYCVATFVMGIGDRHNGNIMVTKSGHLFHIDFGHFLGNFKKKFGVNRERAAFVFTPEMAYVMGGKNYKQAQDFGTFHALCGESFMILRQPQNAALLEILFLLMIPAGMPELLQKADIVYLRNKLHLDVDEPEALKQLKTEIETSLSSTYRRLDNWIHNLVHG